MKKVLLTTICLYMLLALTAQENFPQATDSISRQSGNILVSEYGDSTYTSLPSPISVGKWRIAGDIGFSYRMAKTAEGVEGRAKDFVNKMRAGVIYGAEIHHFPKNSFGFGARFSGHSYSHDEINTSSKVNTAYFAPSIMWRFFDRNYQNAFMWGFSLGYLTYYEKTTIFNDTHTLKKEGVGYTAGIGYNFRIYGNTF